MVDGFPASLLAAELVALNLPPTIGILTQLEDE
jgi:hypothetical protein